jgi:hypothetical protein
MEREISGSGKNDLQGNEELRDGDYWAIMIKVGAGVILFCSGPFFSKLDSIF